jgi:glycosyltransferase involved in cell wall biosynthesis
VEAVVRLGVNGWRLHSHRTGVARYLLNIVKHWTPEVVAGRFDEVNLYTPRPLVADGVELPDSVVERVIGPDWRMLAWENTRFAATATDDVLFCPSYSRPLMARGRTVVTTHDATVHMFPELYPRSSRVFYDRLYGWSARHATLVLTHTETVKQDIARCHGVPLPRIRVVRIAVSEHIKPLGDDPRVPAARERYLGDDVPFFLFVGKLSVRRNIPKLLEAFAELKDAGSLPHKLLVVGLNADGVDVSALATRLGVGEHVAHHETVSEEDLVLLYNAAEAFIMPSTFETLSLPVMEAQAVGTPVITIDTPGLRETTGGAALLMDTADVPTIVDSMSRIAREPALRDELAERGLTHAATWSWRRCSQETLDVLAEARELDPPGFTRRARLRS